jgi:hypothetical protein
LGVVVTDWLLGSLPRSCQDDFPPRPIDPDQAARNGVIGDSLASERDRLLLDELELPVEQLESEEYRIIVSGEQQGTVTPYPAGEAVFMQLTKDFGGIRPTSPLAP